MNIFCFTGNLGQDVKINHTSAGGAVANFSVAVRAGFGDREQTLWIGCSLFGKRAEGGLVQYLKKGQQVAVSGELSTREHEGKTYLQVSVNDVTLIGKRDDSVPAPSQPRQQPQPPKQQPAPADDFDDEIPF